MGEQWCFGDEGKWKKYGKEIFFKKKKDQEVQNLRDLTGG